MKRRIFQTLDRARHSVRAGYGLVMNVAHGVTRPTFLGCVFFFIIALSYSAIAQTPTLTPPQKEFFEKKVQPILSAHCYDCHSHGAEKIRGALALDTREGLLKGGENGPSIIPGDVEKSLLIIAVRYTERRFADAAERKKTFRCANRHTR